jgi:hypothetical protein
MNGKISRRHLATALLATAAPAPAQTQQRTPEAELEAALKQMRSNGSELEKQDVPLTMEPAFIFKA